MKAYRFCSLFSVLIMFCAAGCFRDPSAQKQKFLENGNHYFQEGKYAEAAIEFRNAVKHDPSSADAHYRLAITETKLGDWSYALGELERTVDLQPANVQAQLDLGNLVLAEHDLERADQIAFALTQADPNNASAHSLLANVNEARSRHQDAVNEIDKAIALQPRNPAFHLTRGLFQSDAENLDGAEKSFQKAIDLDLNYADPILGLARIYLKQGRTADAEKYFQRVIAVAPQDPQSRLELARMYLGEHRRDMAEKVLIQAQRDLPNDPNAYLQLPEFYADFGENDKALAQLETLHNRHPKDSKTATDYVRVLLAVNQVDKADQINQEVLARAARGTDNLVLKGEILERRGKPDAAVSVLRNAVRDDPQSASAHYALGSALNQIGDLGSAENEWRQASQLQPSMLEVQRVLARLAATKQDQDLLQNASQQIIENDPQAPDGYIFRGMVEANRNHWDKAEADFNKAIQIAPEKPLGFLNMGQSRLAQQRYREAEKFYEQALERDPNSSDAMRGLIACYRAANQPARTLARVEAQIKKVPENSDYYGMLGELQANNKDYSAAEVSLRKAITLNKNSVNAFVLLGRIEVHEGSFEKAIASSYEWIRENPKDATAYVLTGSLEEQRGDWRKAQDLYNKALQIQPTSAVAENNLAFSMLENGGNTDVALSLAQSAHAQAPTMASIDDTLAWAYYHKGQYKMSIQILQDALKAEPDNAPYHYHIGLAYSKLGDVLQAKSHLQRALVIDPKSSQADLVRKELQQLGG